MRLALWLLRTLSPAEWRESICGDLEEEHRQRAASGRRAGPLWAVTAALLTVTRLRLADRRPEIAESTAGFQPGVLTLEVRLALRSLRTSPGFTAAALIVLAFGIGASTAIFSVVDAVVLRGMPFSQSSRLVAISEVSTAGPAPVLIGAAAPNYFDWQAQQHVFSAMGANLPGRGFIVRTGSEPEQFRALQATASFFDVLRVHPRLGRAFTTHDEIPGFNHVMLISDGLWRRRFGADPAIVGKTMTFDSGVWEIVGVMPPDFVYPVGSLRPTDIWAPYALIEANDKSRSGGRNYTLRVVARLKDGVTIEQARAEMSDITAGLAVRYPKWFAHQDISIRSLQDATVGSARPWMLLLLGSVAFVLLIACVNVANLMLARATTRAREIGIRAALGASRWQIARGLLIESLVLSTAGTICAMVVASWGISLLRASLPEGLPRVADIGMDFRVLGAAALAALVTGLIFGLAPAIQFSRPDLNSILSEGGRSGMAGRARQRLRSWLVVAEVALAVVLLVGAGLFITSFMRLVNVDLGLDYHNVLTAGVNPRVAAADPSSFDRAEAETRPIVADALERVRRIPGVEVAAALSGGTPLSGSSYRNEITVPGHVTFKDDADQVYISQVTPEYARVVRTPVRRGRYLRDSDAKGAQPVVVLNEEAVSRYFGGRDPLGAIVKIDDADRVVVGVVGNVRFEGPEKEVHPEAYVPFAQSTGIGATLVIRTSGDPMLEAPAVRQAVLAALPNVPVAELTTLEASLRGLIAQRKLNMLLIALFGVLAVMIAAAGIYGVMAYVVAQRTREIGVRVALGALQGGVLRMILGNALALMAMGLAIGLVGAWMLAGLVSPFLFAVRPHDPFVYAGVALLLVGAGLLAALVPAHRASRIDPMIALRGD